MPALETAALIAVFAATIILAPALARFVRSTSKVKNYQKRLFVAANIVAIVFAAVGIAGPAWLQIPAGLLCLLVASIVKSDHLSVGDAKLFPARLGVQAGVCSVATVIVLALWLARTLGSGIALGFILSAAIICVSVLKDQFIGWFVSGPANEPASRPVGNDAGAGAPSSTARSRVRAAIAWSLAVLCVPFGLVLYVFGLGVSLMAASFALVPYHHMGFVATALASFFYSMGFKDGSGPDILVTIGLAPGISLCAAMLWELSSRGLFSRSPSSPAGVHAKRPPEGD